MDDDRKPPDYDEARIARHFIGQAQAAERWAASCDDIAMKLTWLEIAASYRHLAYIKVGMSSRGAKQTPSKGQTESSAVTPINKDREP